MQREDWLAKVPQSVVLYGEDTHEVEDFIVKWAASLLCADEEKLFSHPDLFLLRPSNKIRRISVEDVRLLSKEIYRTPNKGDRKVAIIYEADRLHNFAANAFLKTLEEPPEDTVIFLATTKPYLILPTLRSRCWMVNLSVGLNKLRFPLAKWEAWLKDYKLWLKNIFVEENFLNSDKCVLGIYSLIYRVQNFYDELAEYLKKKQLFEKEGLSEEERDAMDAGIKITVWQNIFADIASITRNVLVENELWRKTKLFNLIVKKAQEMYGLVQVNYNEYSALEALFMYILKFAKP